jgi:Protein of unknown function (DUF3237)
MTTADGESRATAEPAPPPLEFVFEANVDIGETSRMGKGRYGERRLIPITGGALEGPRLQGTVLPGGADWQLVRADGDIELDARYPVRASDGALIQVRNRCLVHIPPGTRDPARTYVRTVPEFDAPTDGPHAWLNHSIFIGTLARAGKGRVRIRVFRVG